MQSLFVNATSFGTYFFWYFFSYGNTRGLMECA